MCVVELSFRACVVRSERARLNHDDGFSGGGSGG
jgi:hypothetical protein